MLHAAQNQLFEALVFLHLRHLVVEVGVHVVHHLGDGRKFRILRLHLLAAAGRRRLSEPLDGAEDKGGRQPRDEQADEYVDQNKPDKGGNRVGEHRHFRRHGRR